MSIKVSKHGAIISTLSSDKLIAALKNNSKRRKHILRELSKRNVTVE